ncbi:MAG: sigma-54-dependent Fis family transcriptional regulator [Candidatus Tectomicrobia bacterium]|nr:sigma-54-dependent Fis family transcriptional regulator [Candidatus Tectomicrobia bacterium]
MAVTILILEDDEGMRESLSDTFSRRGYEVFSAGTGAEGLTIFRHQKIDLVLLDLRLPDAHGLDLLKEFKAIDDEVSVIVITAYPDVQTAISAMKGGAFDYINKPFELEELKLLVGKALETRNLKSEVQRLQYRQRTQTGHEIIGESEAIQRVRDLIVRVAQTPHTPILIQGESGVGKELVADAIHYNSQRAGKAIIKINCSAIPETLLESELFGYEKGAFTDARQAKTGLVELADGGSLFLDEISEMNPSLQPKLLRILEGQPFRKVGGTRDIRVDVRIIAASNRDLQMLVRKGLFREDLLYRLNVITILVPPLRERKDDILMLAYSFLEVLRTDLRKEVKTLSEETKELLLSYSWPGNIRELRNVLERAMIVANSETILPEYLPPEIREVTALNRYRPAPGDSSSLTLETLERLHILQTLEEVGGNKSEAARKLGISRNTLKEKLRKFGIPLELS